MMKENTAAIQFVGKMVWAVCCNHMANLYGYTRTILHNVSHRFQSIGRKFNIVNTHHIQQFNIIFVSNWLTEALWCQRQGATTYKTVWHSLLHCSNGWFFGKVGRWYWYWHGVIAAATAPNNKLIAVHTVHTVWMHLPVTVMVFVMLKLCAHSYNKSYASRCNMYTLCMVAKCWNIIPIDDKCHPQKACNHVAVVPG